MAFHTNELAKLAGALLMATLLGASAASIQVGTELLAQMAWALFSLLVFLLQPIATLCRIGPRVISAAAPWMLVGMLVACAKLALLM